MAQHDSDTLQETLASHKKATDAAHQATQQRLEAFALEIKAIDQRQQEQHAALLNAIATLSQPAPAQPAPAQPAPAQPEQAGNPTVKE